MLLKFDVIRRRVFLFFQMMQNLLMIYDAFWVLGAGLCVLELAQARNLFLFCRVVVGGLFFLIFCVQTRKNKLFFCPEISFSLLLFSILIYSS